MEEIFKEFQSIVKALEDNTYTIDEIIVRIGRASKLTIFCHEKLKSTNPEIQQILDEMDA